MMIPFVATTVQDLLQALPNGGLRCVSDSRKVGVGDVFVAWPGTANDGRAYVQTAFEAGAAWALVEVDGIDAFAGQAWFQDARVIRVQGLQSLCGPWLEAYHQSPTQHVHMLAVTGTNGKTSLAWWLSHAFTAVGRSCGMVGTLGVGLPGAYQSTGMTTPDPMVLQDLLGSLRQQQAWGCAIEASSIGIEEKRLDGITVNTVVFTNFTQDHLDYHHSMDAYWQAKRKLFEMPGVRVAVVNVDDPMGQRLTGQLRYRRGLDLWTYGVGRDDARLSAHHVATTAQGMCFECVERNIQGQEVSRQVVAWPAFGWHNVSNALAVLATMRAHEVSWQQALGVCAQLPAVPGRMERVRVANDATLPLVVVDYAHTPDALRQALLSLQPWAENRRGQLWCVVGCGGDRDRTKRPLMAQMAQRMAGRCVFTSDNPRTESPNAILQDMVAGLSHLERVEIIENRAQALAHAIEQAQPQDVVLLAGKGHETTQEIQGVKHPFADLQVAQELLLARSTQTREVRA